MSEFRIGQQVTWGDYLWDVYDPDTTTEIRDEAKFVYLWDGLDKYVWAPLDEVEAY